MVQNEMEPWMEKVNSMVCGGHAGLIEGPLLLEHRDFRVLIIGFDTPQINAIGEKRNSLTRSSIIQTIFVGELRKQCNSLKYIEYDPLHFI